MGFDEKIFAFGHRLFKRITADPMPPYYDQRVDLKDLENRLRIIAKSLCGEPIQVLEAEAMGGYSGVHFYYPKSVCPFPSKKMNELVYIQRTLFCSSAHKLGFCLPPRELTEIEKKVYTCLAIYQVYQFIGLEFPGTTQVIEALSRETQNELKSLNTQDRNTQNGLLAEWIYQILSREFNKGEWKNILCRHHTNTVSFWKFADAVYKEHFASMPLGPVVADEAFILWGFLMPPASPLQMNGNADEDGLTPEALASGTEIQGKNREEVVTVNLQKDGDEPNPVMHAFEKVETLEEYQGGMRTQDGDDNLAEHAEALEELNLREVIRSRERTNSIYKADIRLHGVAPDILDKDDPDGSSKKYLLYPEWDYKKKAYRQDWCRVECRQPVSEAGVFHLDSVYGKEKREITRLFEQVRHRPLWKKRQTEGEELDIDALVNRHADLRSGNSPEDRFYLKSAKHEKDWQCLLLIDSSLSTDSWVANERILDVIKNSVCLMGDALAKEADCISVAAFHSNTRHQCVYQELKGFKESWQVCKHRLSQLEPEGYTRIGPALRHSLELHKKSGARHKLTILLSDGKASDYDQYEGQYGMEDIKQSLREAQQQQVHIKCLAVEETAKFYLPQMFGAGNVKILSSPRKLPQALTALLLPILY